MDIKENLLDKDPNVFALSSTFGMISCCFLILATFIAYYYYLIVSLEEISLQRVLNECHSSGIWMCPILTSILLFCNFLCYFQFPVYTTEYEGNYELFFIIFKYTIGKIIAVTVDIILFIWNVYELSTNCLDGFKSTTVYKIYIINVILLSLIAPFILYFIFIITRHIKKEFYNTQNKNGKQIVQDILHI